MSKKRSTHRSRRIRLPEFMWIALDALTEHTNETAIPDPAHHIDVSALVETVILTSIKINTLRMFSEQSPEFQRIIAAWVEWQIENDPKAVAIFSSGLWNFTMKAN